MEMNREADLIAISKINNELEVYDKATFKLVRKFVGHKNKINEAYHPIKERLHSHVCIAGLCTSIHHITANELIV